MEDNNVAILFWFYISVEVKHETHMSRLKNMIEYDIYIYIWYIWWVMGMLHIIFVAEKQIL